MHIDFVSLLRRSEGYEYILTMIDRYSRWPEVVPLVETSAQTVARGFHDTWIARYGAPETITLDQRSQFESHGGPTAIIFY